MARCALGTWGRVCLLTAAATLVMARGAFGAALDERGEIKLGVRAYTAARVATENTDITICNFLDGKQRCGGSNGRGPTPLLNQTYRSLTFPVSPAGHLRQQRTYVEAELDHNLSRLLAEGFGPLALLDDLPFKFQTFKYHLTYRGEYEGVYDYGPSEYRTHYQYENKLLVPDFSGNSANIGQSRRRLRSIGVIRNRLFQAYLETQVERLQMRFGRQILSWGQTDAFRLLDNINPLDNSFGGFLIPLDERRQPLDMLLLNYSVGELGPLYEMFVEAYAAIDDAIGFQPGIPQGSPWSLPNLGAPSAVLQTQRTQPQRVVKDTRGGFRINFTAPIPVIEDMDVSLANYWTYLDNPMVQTYVNPRFPLAIQCGPDPSKCNPATGFLANSVQTGPRVQITGVASSFNFPMDWARAMFLSGQPIVRYELAYFRGEQRPTQQQLDPFIYGTGNCARGRVIDTPYGPLCTGGRRYGDSWNFVLGFDLNQFIRPLNPNQSFFITTQFFYKHLNGAAPRTRQGIELQNKRVFKGEVLPVPSFNVAAPFLPSAGASQSVLIHNPVDQYLNTLLITTSYFSSQINPALTLFYDWSGSFVAQPQIVLSRDPFRFTFAYSFLTAGTLKGASGVSLLRDRDNVLFQLDYVI
jgi:hypothetical protein